MGIAVYDEFESPATEALTLQVALQSRWLANTTATLIGSPNINSAPSQGVFDLETLRIEAPVGMYALVGSISQSPISRNVTLVVPVRPCRWGEVGYQQECRLCTLGRYSVDKERC